MNKDRFPRKHINLIHFLYEFFRFKSIFFKEFFAWRLAVDSIQICSEDWSHDRSHVHSQDSHW